MGYTHYHQYETVGQEGWNNFVVDCFKLFLNRPEGFDICREYDLVDFAPHFDRDCVIFNGPGELGHETFVLYRKKPAGFQFTETARKPYDLMVCACLLLYTYHFPGTFEFNSDGGPEDWEESRDSIKKVLGYDCSLNFLEEE